MLILCIIKHKMDYKCFKCWDKFTKKEHLFTHLQKCDISLNDINIYNIITDKDKEIYELKMKMNNITQSVNADIHDTLIELNDNYSGVYLALIDTNIVKFGRTTDIKTRVNQHLKTFNQFKLFYFVINFENTKLESILKKHQKLKPNLTTMTINGIKHNELFELNSNLSINDIKYILLDESKKLVEHQIKFTKKETIDK